MNATQRAEWLERRRNGVGSSDAPAILGVSPWATSLDVYLDKTGATNGKTVTKEMEWGLRHEPAIAAAYEDRTGCPLFTAGMICQHSQFPWMLASLDRIRKDPDDKRIVELKTCNPFTADEWGEEGTDQIPRTYIVQVQHQMAVTGYDLADVAVLIGLADFRIYTVPRCQPLIDVMIEREREFLDKVQSRTPPEPDWRHHVTLDTIRLLFGIEDETIHLDETAIDLVNRHEEAKARESAAKSDKDRAKAELLYMMRTASRAELLDGTVLSRKEVHRKAYHVKETSYLDFRIKRAKEILV